MFYCSRRHRLRGYRRDGRREGVIVGNSMDKSRQSVFVDGTLFSVSKCRGMPRRGDVILIAANPTWFDSSNQDVIYIVKRVVKRRVSSFRFYFIMLSSLFSLYRSSCPGPSL